jgi:aminoglycoside/choline kinase family phosphotransferase
MSDLEGLFAQVFSEPEVTVTPMHAHASERKLYRLRGKRKSAIGVINLDFAENRAFAAITNHLLSFHLPVPKLFAEIPEKGVALIEDLGDVTLYDLLASTPRTGSEFPLELEKLYGEVLELLPRFQIEAGCSLNFDVCYPRRTFDRKAMVGDAEYFLGQFVKRLGIPVAEDEFRLAYGTLIDYLSHAESGYFMLRDLQSRNIMVREGQVYFIDYQRGSRGPMQYDVVSLLYQSRAQIPPEARERLLRRYLAVAGKYTSIREQEFRAFLHGFVILRLMQVLGTYGKVGLGEGKAYFRDSIPFALKALSEVIDTVQLPCRLDNLFSIFRMIIQRAPDSHT